MSIEKSAKFWKGTHPPPSSNGKQSIWIEKYMFHRFQIYGKDGWRPFTEISAALFLIWRVPFIIIKKCITVMVTVPPTPGLWNTGYFRKVYRNLQVRVPRNSLKYLSIQKLLQKVYLSIELKKKYKYTYVNIYIKLFSNNLYHFECT